MTIQETINQAIAHHKAGRLGEAEALYRQVLSREPNHPDALHMLGVIAHSVGRHDVAEQLLRRSLSFNPMQAGCLANLGLVLVALHRGKEAEAVYRQALALQPDLPEALNNLGMELYRQDKLDQAIECYRKALSLQPDYVDALNNLGNALGDQKKSTEAIALYRRVLALKPDDADAYNNLGAVAVEQGRLDEALEFFFKGASLQKNHADVFSNIANVMYRKCRMEEAIAYCRRAIAIKPDFAMPHWNLGLCLLCTGNFQEGWKEYAWRTRVKDLGGTFREFSQPRWTGGDLKGQTILLHSEQGLGDTIQFIRFAPIIKSLGAKIVCLVEKSLTRLLRGVAAVDQWIEPGKPLPAFDVHCPLLGLPMVLGINLRNIPANVPYVFAEPELSDRWQARLKDVPGKKVGLVWAGRAEHRNDFNRSMPLSSLFPLAEIPGISFISLQKGDAAKQSPGPLKLFDWTNDLHDFADTAALIANLDLVISVDTSVVHLAGAMGKPTWVLLPFSPDWRWMLHREDSPWYPMLRLFRQATDGDWNQPVRRAAQTLQALVNSEGRG